MLPGAGGVVEAGEQAGAVGPSPRQCLLLVSQDGNRGRNRAAHGGRAGACLAGQVGVSAGGGVLVVIQQPGNRVSVLLRVNAVGQGAGVLADEVVRPVAALGRLAQQVLVVKGLQAPAGGGQATAVQGGGGVLVDIFAGMQAEPSEQPLLIGSQVSVGQVERGRHRQALGLHQGQPVPRRRQLSRPPGGGPRRVMTQLTGHHPDRQRQVPAQPGDLPHSRVTWSEPGTARQPHQQRRGLLRRQGVQADRRRIIQRRQVPAARHQHQAAARARKQRPHLIAVGRVIQHQQQRPVRHPVPPQRRPRPQPRRDLPRRNPDGQQQARQRVRRIDRRPARGVPVQLQENLPAGEPAG